MQKWGDVFHAIHRTVKQMLKQTTRASSLVENLNGRLRCYFFLRRQIGQPYLELLRFYLNHHCYLRSAHPERGGRSPAELLAGKKHLHWLEMLEQSDFRLN